MLLIFSYFITIAISQCWVNTTNNSISTFTYKQLVDSTSSKCYDYVMNNDEHIILKFNLKSTEVIFDYCQRIDYKDQYIRSYSYSYPPNFNMIRVLPQAIKKFYVKNTYFSDNLYFFYGCFDKSECFDDDDYIFVFRLYSKSCKYFCDELDLI